MTSNQILTPFAPQIFSQIFWTSVYASGSVNHSNLLFVSCGYRLGAILSRFFEFPDSYTALLKCLCLSFNATDAINCTTASN